jgi:4-hydroxybenzoate polyprenyltransferase
VWLRCCRGTNNGTTTQICAAAALHDHVRPFTGYTQTINDWYDKEIDAISEPYRLILGRIQLHSGQCLDLPLLLAASALLPSRQVRSLKASLCRSTG